MKGNGHLTRASALFSAAALFCISPITGAAADDYKIGLVLSLSGVGSAYADQAQQAVALALDEINANNLAGRPVSIITVDDATDPKTAAEVCSRLVLQDKVQAIVGQEPTPARIACNQSAQKAGVPYVSAAPGGGDLCIRNLFTVGPVPNQMNAPMLEYLLSINLKHVYLIGSDFSGPRFAAAGSEKYLKENGGTTAGSSFVPMGGTDYVQDLAKIAAAKPDAVLEMVVGNDGPAFHKQFANDPRVASVKQADLFLTESGAKALGKAAAGTYVSAGYLAALDTAENKSFLGGLTKKFGDRAKPDLWGVFAYNAMHVLAGAVKAGGSDSKAVMAALGTAKFTGPNGEINIENNYTRQVAYIGQVDDTGAIKVVKKMGAPSPQLSCSFQ
jgi:ABC-type branched-subunit amino acid transport system substrate-binding protein